MKIFIGADHNGFHLRKALVSYLQRAGYDAIDDGEAALDPADDYPVFAARVVHDMKSSGDSNVRGILICGSGQGMCMAANRFRGIRAALGHDRESIRSARHDDDANILCLPAHTMKKNEAYDLVEVFLNTSFSHIARHKRRIREMDEL